MHQQKSCLKWCNDLTPWRLTLNLGDGLNVLEWGDCLPDCPSEPINSACLSDPLFPIIGNVEICILLRFAKYLL